MYKVTTDGKTMVGCNEDAWRTTSRIWFENAESESEYGAAFTGSRQVSNNRTAPQSGMNEAGLTFSRLASYFPKQSTTSTGKIKITDEVAFLTDILHKCASTEEVKKYIARYDHSFFIDDVFI
jgi:penicillin V acylase-like amidase (Ntn superfamily)